MRRWPSTRHEGNATASDHACEPARRNGLEVLQEWRRLRDRFVGQGLSRHASYKRIAAAYGCHFDTVHTWLEPERKAEKTKINHSLLYTSDYATKILPRNRMHSWMRYHIDECLLSAMGSTSRRFTLEEAAQRIRDERGILLHENTLEKALRDYSVRTGRQLVARVSGGPPAAYRLVYRPG